MFSLLISLPQALADTDLGTNIGPNPYPNSYPPPEPEYHPDAYDPNAIVPVLGPNPDPNSLPLASADPDLEDNYDWTPSSYPGESIGYLKPPRTGIISHYDGPVPPSNAILPIVGPSPYPNSLPLASGVEEPVVLMMSGCERDCHVLYGCDEDWGSRSQGKDWVCSQSGKDWCLSSGGTKAACDSILANCMGQCPSVAILSPEAEPKELTTTGCVQQCDAIYGNCISTGQTKARCDALLAQVIAQYIPNCKSKCATGKAKASSPSSSSSSSEDVEESVVLEQNGNFVPNIDSKPAGFYQGYKDYHGEQVWSNITIHDDNHLEVNLHGKMKVHCKNEPYTMTLGQPPVKNVILSGWGLVMDCFTEYMKANDATLNSVTWNSQYNNFQLAVTTDGHYMTMQLDHKDEDEFEAETLEIVNEEEMYSPKYVNAKPAGFYQGYFNYHGEQVWSNITIHDDDHLEVNVHGKMKIHCKNEPYTMTLGQPPVKNVILTGWGQAKDCFTEYMNANDATLNSVTWNSQYNNFQLAVTTHGHYMTMQLNHAEETLEIADEEVDTLAAPQYALE